MGWEKTVVQVRRDLHRIPELALEEVQTRAYLTEALERMGLSIHPLAATGFYTEIEGKSGKGKTVALRTDMDALPLEEATELPFRSQHPGRMHACGHDGHMAIVLATAERLIEEGRDFRGTVRLLFQPAEERPPGGAPLMIAAGALEGVDEIFGLHLWSTIPLGTAAIRSGPIMANADQFAIHIEGRGGHGSQPEQTRDGVLIAAQTVVNLQQIVARRIAATDPAVVSCGTIHAGSIFNIIPETAEITGTVRTLSQSVQQTVKTEMERIVQATAAMHGASAVFKWEYGYPALINHVASVKRYEAAVAPVVTVTHPNPFMGGEDFSYYLKEIPGAFLFLGCQPDGDAFPNHSPRFLLNEAALPLGVEIFVRIAKAALKNPHAN